jgi:hypothetical protein
MINKIILPALTIITFYQGILGAIGPSKRQKSELLVHNRVLAKINTKVFSVIDLTKKLELVFYRQFPQFAQMPEAKYEFFKANWRRVLDELIDSELVVANAKEVNLIVSDGDVRQEIQKVFGPSVVDNIDSLDMTYEEAFKLLSNEIIVQRMMFSMAQMHAISSIGPQEIRNAYEKYAKENPIEESWRYRVVSVKSKDIETSKLFAHLCHNMLSEKSCSLENLSEVLSEKNLLKNGVTVTVNEPMTRKISELSKAHKEVLKNLPANIYSKPDLQKTKYNENQTIARIFYIEKYTPQGIVSLKEVENELKNTLIEKAVEEKTKAYRTKLRKRYGIDEGYLKQMIPENFEPFTLNFELV